MTQALDSKAIIIAMLDNNDDDVLSRIVFASFEIAFRKKKQQQNKTS